MRIGCADTPCIQRQEKLSRQAFSGIGINDSRQNAGAFVCDPHRAGVLNSFYEVQSFFLRLEINEYCAMEDD